MCIDAVYVPRETLTYDDTNEPWILHSEEVWHCHLCKNQRALAHGRWDDALELLCGACGGRYPWEGEAGIANMREVISAAAGSQSPPISGRAGDAVARALAALADGTWTPTRGADHVTATYVVRDAEAADGELTAEVLSRAVGYAGPWRPRHTRTWVDAVAYTHSALLKPAADELAEAGQALLTLARAVASLDQDQLPATPPPTDRLPFA
ncbi:hypothetical protein [Kitasatospora sp. NPDC056531]|uniref:hypothetical protein n=1 Tax=Kitasatospora sp. NPDC056531 TaxID=3345856 RepID=UPI0036B86A41